MKMDGGEEGVEQDIGRGLSRRAVASGFAAATVALVGSTAARAASTDKAPFRPGFGTDYATTDPRVYDPVSPPIHFPHTFKSQGKTIQSFMWLAGGEEPKGCVILSPQLNGGDSLDSVIPTLLGAGINVMRFNPRGMWDDEDDYTIKGSLEDLQAAVAFLRENGGHHMVAPGNAWKPRSYQINLDRIAVFGRSGGGGTMGWVAAAEDPKINAVIAVNPVADILHPIPPEYVKFFNDQKESTAGRVDMMKILSNLSPEDYRRLSMIETAPKLVNTNVLLIGSSQNDSAYVTTSHPKIVEAMNKAGAKHFTSVILQADGYFLTARIELARLMVSWLKTECGF